MNRKDKCSLLSFLPSLSPCLHCPVISWKAAGSLFWVPFSLLSRLLPVLLPSFSFSLQDLPALGSCCFSSVCVSIPDSLVFFLGFFFPLHHLLWLILRSLLPRFLMILVFNFFPAYFAQCSGFIFFIFQAFAFHFFLSFPTSSLPSCLLSPDWVYF